MLKALLTMGAASSRVLSDQIKFSGNLVRESLDRLRAALLVTHRGTADLVDFVFELTESGAQRAKHYALYNSYCGAAPVPLEHYVVSVRRQSITRVPIRLDAFRQALEEIYLSIDVQSQLAQAVNAGRGMFLYGAPGNGKTTVAERLSRCYTECMWIPRSIVVGGDIIRLYDSSVHEAVDPALHGCDAEPEHIDRRWVLIRRPTIVVGGELLLEHLEISRHHGSGVLEAPVQMKSNGGTLLVDDFGRQRISPTDILNRWIVPLERRVDFLTLPSGRQIQVPFDQNLVFATNLEPCDLVDEAFLRRIPYKIELPSPDESTFREVFESVARKMQIEIEEGALDYLIENYYRNENIGFRFCQPRDLLLQVANICELHELPNTVTQRALDVVVRNYFSGLRRFTVGDDRA